MDAKMPNQNDPAAAVIARWTVWRIRLLRLLIRCRATMAE